MPISDITFTAFGFKPTGLVPALNTSYWSLELFLKSPSAIWLRAELPVQGINTRFLDAILLAFLLVMGNENR